jgi:hypothetical protein
MRTSASDRDPHITENEVADLIMRFFIGGAVVSLFAVIGDLLRPKSFAGLFGAAPSVALATLALAFSKEGPGYVAIEGRSMLLGALALAFYSFAVCQLMMRWRVPALKATLGAVLLWLVIAVGFEQWLVG